MVKCYCGLSISSNRPWKRILKLKRGKYPVSKTNFFTFIFCFVLLVSVLQLRCWDSYISFANPLIHIGFFLKNKRKLALLIIFPTNRNRSYIPWAVWLDFFFRIWTQHNSLYSMWDSATLHLSFSIWPVGATLTLFLLQKLSSVQTSGLLLLLFFFVLWLLLWPWKVLKREM